MRLERSIISSARAPREGNSLTTARSSEPGPPLRRRCPRFTKLFSLSIFPLDPKSDEETFSMINSGQPWVELHSHRSQPRFRPLPTSVQTQGGQDFVRSVKTGYMHIPSDRRLPGDWTRARSGSATRQNTKVHAYFRFEHL